MRIILLVLLLTVPVLAQMDGNPENWCRDGFFTRDSTDFTVAFAKGSKTKRAYFYGDEKESCPGGAGCQRKSFIVGGDEVLINRSRDGYSCAWYTARNGKPTVGWLKTSDLEFDQLFLDGSTKAWLGEWVFYENSIEFTNNKLAGFLNVTGIATWKGLGDNVHVGEIDGRYAPESGVINYSDGDGEYDCRMTIRLLGRYLIVADNLKCGGVNVTFSGVYSKVKK